MAISLLYPLRLTEQLLNFVVRVGLFVASGSAERYRVHWVLRFFLVEDVIMTVLPIWVIGLVAAHFYNRPVFRLSYLNFCSIFLSLTTFKLILSSCLRVHLMWVDYLGFFFKVKSLLVRLNACQLKFS